MPGEKFLKHNGSGGFTEVVSTQTGGAGNENKIAALDGNGRFAETMMPTGIAADTALIQASENLSAGDAINIYEDTGAARCRKADATSAGKRGDGFVTASVTSGQNATVYFEGENGEVSGLTPGLPVYLATTAGAVTQTAPSGSGNVVQRVGIAISATAYNFEPETPVVLA